MASIDELIQKIQQLQDQLAEQTEKVDALMTEAREAVDYASHAYRVDHYGFLWVWDTKTQDFKKTNMRICTPKIADRALESRHIADNAIEGRHLQDNIIEGRMVKNKTIDGRSFMDCIFGPEFIIPNSIHGDSYKAGALIPGKIADDAIWERNIMDRNVTAQKIAKGNIYPEHLHKSFVPLVIRPITDDLQNQIDSLEIAGVAVSNEFGIGTHISISQNTLTKAFNKLWQKLEDMTGEVLQGISMSVIPDYFISEDGCSVHISANTVETNGIFEHIAFYGNGSLIAEADNVDFFEYDTEITETTIIKCVAKIMGVEYPRQQIVTHYNSFWLGAGSTYSDIMNVEHVIPITNGMRGAYDVDVAQGQHIIIIVGESLAGGFLRADLNGIEIPFTESTVTVDDKDYRVFISENTYNAGTYNIDING